MQTLTVTAIFENGVFRPTTPISLTSPQPVTLIVQMPKQTAWPADVAKVYQEIAEEDGKLAQGMLPHIAQTWPPETHQ